jgi:dsRNA-specific ribonuclease
VLDRREELLEWCQARQIPAATYTFARVEEGFVAECVVAGETFVGQEQGQQLTAVQSAAAIALTALRSADEERASYPAELASRCRVQEVPTPQYEHRRLAQDRHVAICTVGTESFQGEDQPNRYLAEQSAAAHVLAAMYSRERVAELRGLSEHAGR